MAISTSISTIRAKAKLSENAFVATAKIARKLVSKDGTIKYLFRLTDGNCIESVVMKYKYGYTICVSSQIGCKMGCKFCASTGIPFSRNLEAGEIVEQLLAIERDAGVRISNIVFMGIGEPFDNYDNLIDFLRIINDAKGLEIGSRHITVSTCGIVPKIIEYSDFELQVNLAVSLHFADNEKRSKYMLINRAYDINELMESIKYYYSKTNRRITFEYILLKDINDSLEDAKKLIKLIKGINCYVNLIPMNSTVNEFTRSTKEKMKSQKLSKGLIAQIISLIILMALVIWSLFNRDILPYANFVAAITFFIIAFNKKEDKRQSIILIAFGIVFVFMAIGGLING